MKNIFLQLLPLALLCLSSCNKDQRMTNQVDGVWEIEQITFTRNGQDSVVMAPIGVFNFEKCKLGNGNCPGYYDLENQDRVEIGYNVDADLNEFHMNVISDAVVNLGGTYAFDDFSKENLNLTGKASIKKDGGGANYYDVNIDLKKK